MWTHRILLAAATSLLLLGCKSAQEQAPAYELAQQCIAIQALDSRDYLVADGDNGYRFAASDEASAEKFFLKPSGLGTFLLFDRDKRFLATRLIHVTRDSTASRKTEWRINKLALFSGRHKTGDAYTLISIVDNLRLQQGKSGPIIKATGAAITTAVALDLISQPADACAEFPEAALDAEVAEDFYPLQNPASENAADMTAATADAGATDSHINESSSAVTGFVDLHTHLGFPKAMAGLAMAGDLFHPYGIEQALKDCAYLHGENGKLDLLESERADGADGGHATAGYPDFTYWPRRDTSTHVQAYYRWLQRAYLSGLRLMVTDVTGNPTACGLFSLLKPGRAQGDCSSDSEVESQTRYIYALQDYIDAQEGGPGQGWLRIVLTPQQARTVIRQNKLAVVLGSEYGTLFDCHESSAFCTPDYIDQQLEKLYALGIRSVFPIHRFDNAFGGTRPAGGSAGAFMHLASKLSTSNAPNLTQMLDPFSYLFKPIGGHYWQLEQCPAGIEGTQDILSMAQFVNQDFRAITDGLSDIPTIGATIKNLLDFAFFNKLQPLPDYSEFGHADHVCNSIGLQPMGRYLVNRLMDKGLIVEIDHMGYYTSLDALDIMEQRQYSGVVSSHGWMENSAELRQRIFRLGGQISPFNHRPGENAKHMKQYEQEMQAFPFAIGVGIGSDVQGVTSQTDGDPDVTIRYPFQSVDGKVTFTPPKTGNRSFDYNSEGMANYGLLAEWVEDMRQKDQHDPADLLAILMNSAESYLQMWERAQTQAIE